MDPLTMLALTLDPSLLLDELGFDPLPWQRQLLRSTSDKILLNVHRQGGKSVATASLGIWTALSEPGALILVVSASQRQANELTRKVAVQYKRLGTPIPLVEDSATTLALATGSRVVSLPDSVDTIVCFSGPRLIIVDEAARVSDATFIGVRPMLTDSKGKMVCMSTPRGKRGWFHDQWHSDKATWERIEYRAVDNPRVDPLWLAEERLILGPRWYLQEYGCQFLESDDAMFLTEAIEAAFDDSVEPLFTTQ
jgi:hypothetical protein